MNGYKAPRRDRRKRPTESVIERAEDYLDNHELLDHVFPTNPGLAWHLKVPLQLLEDWVGKADSCESCARFADVFHRIRDKRHHYLVHEGVEGHAGQGVTSLVLQSDFGYSKKDEAKVQHEAVVKVDLDLSPEEASKRYRELMGGGK